MATSKLLRVRRTRTQNKVRRLSGSHMATCNESRQPPRLYVLHHSACIAANDQRQLVLRLLPTTHTSGCAMDLLTSNLLVLPATNQVPGPCCGPVACC